MLKRVDWWFAYTDSTRDIVLQAGYPCDRVTVLNNAIDNVGFANDLGSVGDAEVAGLRRQIGATDHSAVGLYCGSLYPDKRLDLLLGACKLVEQRQPNFKLVVLGDGPDRDVLQAAQGLPWLHWMGVKRGRDKAAWFRAAQLYLSPGAVGLHVLDSFVAGLTMVTTADALHGPEIAYLKHELNGLVSAGTDASYAAAVLAVLSDTTRFQRLRAAALESAALYSLDSMVRRFTQGMLDCVSAPRLTR